MDLLARPARSTLLVVESPAKALTLRRWLGPGWDVRATSGHLLDLPRHREGIDVEHGFEPAWELVRGRSRTLSELKRASRRAGRVLLATDPDREGEAIAWQLAAELGAEGGSPRVMRVRLGSLEPGAVERALADPLPLDRGRWEAQLARRVVDRLVGFRLSARLSAALQPSLGAGRVQAAALRLAAAWRPPRPGQAPPAGPPGPPPPFTTEALLREAAGRLRLRPGRTMALAQRLYDGVTLGDGGRTGLVTYPRTGSSWVPGEADQAARALVARRHGPGAVAPPERGGPPPSGQEAVRPTSVEHDPESLQDALRAAGGRDLARLYGLIWERFIESRMALAGPGRRSEPARAAARPGPAVLDEGLLLALVASRGVGRPSTFASIGESLVARGYLERSGLALAVTPLGHRVVAWLDRTFPGTLDAPYTADLEARLDEVEAGRVPWRAAVEAAWRPLSHALVRVVA